MIPYLERSNTVIRIGTILYGFCGGNFGRDSYCNKRVEGIGVDWVVARGEDGEPLLASGKSIIEELEEYTKPEAQD